MKSKIITILLLGSLMTSQIQASFAEKFKLEWKLGWINCGVAFTLGILAGIVYKNSKEEGLKIKSDDVCIEKDKENEFFIKVNNDCKISFEQIFNDFKNKEGKYSNVIECKSLLGIIAKIQKNN